MFPELRDQSELDDRPTQRPRRSYACIVDPFYSFLGSFPMIEIGLFVAMVLITT